MLITLQDDVGKLPDSNDNEIGDKLAQFNKRHEGKAEPQTEHTAQIRYVLHCLHTTHDTIR